jgi:hypothetical protein
MQKITEWAKQNPKLAAAAFALVFTALGNLTGWTFAARAAGAGEKPGIVIVLPEDFGDVFAANPAVVGADELPTAGRNALRAAGNHLRRSRAEREPFSRCSASFTTILTRSRSMSGSRRTSQNSIRSQYRSP